MASNCAPKTTESYREQIRCHLSPALGQIALASLLPEHLTSYYAHALVSGRTDGDGGLSRRTVLYQHRILARALKHAMKQGLVARNVAEAVDPPRPGNAQIAVLTPEDAADVMDAAKETPYYTFLYTLLYTGLRRGEALALRWRFVDLDMLRLWVVGSAAKLRSAAYIVREPKTAKGRREVTMPPSLALVLRKHKTEQAALRLLLGQPLTEDDFVFARVDGTPLNPDTVTHAFSKLIRKAGCPHVRLHDLRHTHATLLLKEGVHPNIVQERLGHANVATTLNIYSHVLPGLQEAAAERFDRPLEPRVSKRLATPSASDSGR